MARYTPTITIFRRHHMNDWLSMTRSPRCTFTDRGVLIEALDLYWRGGCEGLPAEASSLADEIGCSVDEARSMLEHTTGHEIIDGEIHWETIEVAYKDAMATRMKNIASGKASALSRTNERSTSAQQTTNQPETTSHNPETTIHNQLGVSTGGGGSPFKISRRILE